MSTEFSPRELQIIADDIGYTSSYFDLLPESQKCDRTLNDFVAQTASLNGHACTLRYLAEQGTDLDKATGAEKTTPLQNALDYGNAECIAVLKEWINRKDGFLVRYDPRSTGGVPELHR